MLADWLIVLCLCLCLCLCQHVLTGHYSDISLSTSIRGTQGFDKLMLMLMLMWWPSSLVHKAWFTLRHKHKHKHKHKHNECSHLLHKHKESDIRKRNELQNEAAEERTSHVFKMADEDEIFLLKLLLRKRRRRRREQDLVQEHS